MPTLKRHKAEDWGDFVNLAFVFVQADGKSLALICLWARSACAGPAMNTLILSQAFNFSLRLSAKSTAVLLQTSNTVSLMLESEKRREWERQVTLDFPAPNLGIQINFISLVQNLCLQTSWLIFRLLRAVCLPDTKVMHRSPKWLWVSLSVLNKEGKPNCP